MADITISF